MRDASLLERLLAALIEPELRDDLFAELENETDRLCGELSPAEAERWRRRQLVVSVGPMLVRRAALGDSLGHIGRPRMETLVQDLRFAAFYRTLIDSVRAVPGVDFASLAVKLPLAGRSSFGDVSVPGLEPPPGRHGFDTSLNRVSSGYFATLGIPLLGGRELLESDRAEGSRVAVINRAMAERLWRWLWCCRGSSRPSWPP